MHCHWCTQTSLRHLPLVIQAVTAIALSSIPALCSHCAFKIVKQATEVKTLHAHDSDLVEHGNPWERGIFESNVMSTVRMPLAIGLHGAFST